MTASHDTHTPGRTNAERPKSGSTPATSNAEPTNGTASNGADHLAVPPSRRREVAEPRTLLVTLTGRDRPGVTTRVFDALAAYPIEVLDVEQVVLRGRLVLGLLVTAPPDQTAPPEQTARPDQTTPPPIGVRLTELATDLGLELEIAAGAGDNAPRAAGRTHVTILGSPLRPAAMARIAGRVAALGANIDRVVRLARTPVTALELDVSGNGPHSPATLRAALAAEAVEQGIDIAVQPAGLYRRAKRLVVLDVDSTLIRGEVIEMLAAHAGCRSEVAAITERAMAGGLDFAASLRERVALLEGLPATALDEVRSAVRLTPGARTLVRTLHRLGYRIALVSGGFSQVVEPLGASLGIDLVAANTLEVVGGRLTGRVVGPVVDRAGKAEALRRFAAEVDVPLEQTVAVGDGANDLDMLAAAGLGVAFDAKPVVRAAADTSVSAPYLDAILYLLGISREEIDAETPYTTGLSAEPSAR